MGQKYFKGYGKWNEFLFSAFIGAYLLSFILAIVSHISIKRREAADSQKLVMVRF